MWWATRAAKRGQAIQDRWCAACRNTGEHLIDGLWVQPKVQANADGDPAAQGKQFPENS